MNDLRFAFRQLLKNPGFTAVTVLTLALGIAASSAILSIINAYLLRSLPYPTAHCVYHVRYAPPGPYEPRGMTAIDWKALDDVVEDSIAAAFRTFYLMNSDGVTATRSLQASPGFFRGLGVHPVIGRTFVKEEFEAGGEEVVMI